MGSETCYDSFNKLSDHFTVRSNNARPDELSSKLATRSLDHKIVDHFLRLRPRAVLKVSEYVGNQLCQRQALVTSNPSLL